MVNWFPTKNMDIKTSEAKRSLEIYQLQADQNYKFVDKLFSYIMILQFLFAIAMALIVSPYTWQGATSSIHLHLWATIILGGIFTIFPVFLASSYPGKTFTRHIIAISQVLMSSLLIHVTGGRIETHFHIFGSLAFLAFYKDWKVLISASIVITIDHLVRGLYFPLSVFGVLTASEWRWLEHAGWVIFEDIFLVILCLRTNKENIETAIKQTHFETANAKLIENEKYLKKTNQQKEKLTKINDEIYLGYEVESFAEKSLEILTEQFKTLISAFYFRKEGRFTLSASHGCENNKLPLTFRKGETLLGEAVKTQDITIVTEAQEGILIHCGFGTIIPKSIVYVPITYNKVVHGLIILASLEVYKDEDLEFLKIISERFALRLESVVAEQKTKELLHKTKNLANELKIQNQEIRKSQEVLKQKNIELDQIGKHKSEFIANMSHELRTPLNAMIGYTVLTVKNLTGKIEDENIKNLKKAEKSARNLLQIINDILDFSKIEAGKAEVYNEKLDLIEITEDCIDNLEGLANDKSIFLTLEQKSNNKHFVYSDYTKLKQIFTNIIGNAIKFTSQGGITIAVEMLKKHIKVDIKDSGCGIPEASLKNIFESFKQVDSSTQKRYGGTGLGLAISKRFCDLLGISIKINSTVNVGTTFILEIPTWQENEDTIEKTNALENTKKMPIDITETEEEDMLKAFMQELNGEDDQEQVEIKTVLKDSGKSRIDVGKNLKIKAFIPCIINDKSFSSLKKYLGDLPFEIKIADAEWCINHPDNIWAIVIEPGLMGFEKLQLLQQHKNTKNIPVILFSEKDEKPSFCSEIKHWIHAEEKDILNAFLRATHYQKGEVLIVEDDQDIAEIYRDTLETSGYRCTLALSGEEGYKAILNNENFQLILLDLLLPEMNGFEFLIKLQNNKNLRRIPIIISTAKDISISEKNEMREGCNLFLEKGKFLSADINLYVEEIIETFKMARSRSILVVDDNPTNLELICSLLKDSGYNVSSATSGKNIVEKTIQENPDIVLMDLAMPEIDGFEATKEIKANSATLHTTIIACSAFDTPSFKAKAFSAGCEGYITKPIEPDLLIEQIQKYSIISKIAFFEQNKK